MAGNRAREKREIPKVSASCTFDPRFFCQRYSRYVSRTLWRGLSRSPEETSKESLY
jgi:hypothetical protein